MFLYVRSADLEGGGGCRVEGEEQTKVGALWGFIVAVPVRSPTSYGHL